jgi:multiple antibiotic resistance protein
MEIPIALLISLYFILLGPLKVFGIYGKATAHADKSLALSIANASVILATVVAVLMVVIGGFLMSRFNLSVGTLAIAMSVYLGHWAWGKSMGIESKREDVPNPENPTKASAITPIAFPGILPPQGMVLLILSSTMVIETEGFVRSDMWTIIGLIVGVMVLNWIFMVSVGALMKFPGRIFWMLASRSLGVVAFALSVQILLFGLRDLGIIN